MTKSPAIQWTLSSELKVTIAGKFAIVEHSNYAHLYERFETEGWKKIFPKQVYGEYVESLEIQNAFQFPSHKDQKSEALSCLYNKYLDEVITQTTF